MGNSLQKPRTELSKLGLLGALAFGALVLPSAGRAADLSAVGWAEGLRMQLAASGSSLSADDMAREKGAGLSRPGFIDQRTDGLPRVLLWDEMRMWPTIKPTGDGVVTGNGIGR